MQHTRVLSSTIAHKADINPPDKNAANKHALWNEKQKKRNKQKIRGRKKETKKKKKMTGNL